MADGADHCTYCGATLDEAYYFCAACATPYKPEASVLPPEHRLRLTAGQRIRAKAPQATRLFWTYFAVVLGGGILAHLVLGEERPAATLVVMEGLLLATTVVFSVTHWRALRPQLTRTGFGRWEAWAGLAALAPLLLLNDGYHTLLRDLVGADGSSFIDALREAGLSPTALVLSIAVFPGITEEIAFRGLLQHWLHVAVRPATAISIAAALFAAMHFSVLSFPYLFLVGLLLGWLKWRTGSLWPAMAAHLLHNLAVLAWLDT